MKIEKISENQIRCTLTREDLAAREIRLSELAYGSEKTRMLFQDMMQQASRDCGFEVNNTPLMIEAVPVSADSIILIITKVDDPDELDSRFSRFSPEETDTLSPAQSSSLTGIDDILNLISRISAGRKEQSSKTAAAPAAAEDHSGEESSQDVYNLGRFFLFRDMEPIIAAAHVTDPSFDGPSSLFRNPEDGNYYLIIRKAGADAGLFNKVCNMISEYGLQVDYTPGTEEFFGEHMENLLRGNALQTLSQI